MGKWECMQCITNSEKWFIYDVDGEMPSGEWIGKARDEETARQIVREHNAHGTLVELITRHRERLDTELARARLHDMGERLILSIMDDIKHIDAVLAQAEGRE